jgi:hypothetical protein
MSINWLRLIIGGLVATVICFLSDGFLHEALLKNDWAAVYATIHATMPTENAGSMVYFAIFELGRGFVGLFIYVAMRALSQPGPKTAVIAGIVTWLAFSVTGPAQFIPLGFLSNPLWMKMVGFQLITTIIAIVVGAAIYKGK